MSIKGAALNASRQVICRIGRQWATTARETVRRRTTARRRGTVTGQRSGADLDRRAHRQFGHRQHQHDHCIIFFLAEKYGRAVIIASRDPKAQEKFKKVYNMRDGSFV